MTIKKKALWKSEQVTIVGVEHKSSFGDLLKIKLKTGREIIVLSTKLQKYKDKGDLS